MTETILREIVRYERERWRGARISHHAPTLKSEPDVLSIFADDDDGQRNSTVTIPMSKIERACRFGRSPAGPNGLVSIIQEALDRLHAQHFPAHLLANKPRAPRPPKGWRLFGRTRAVVLA